MLAIPALRDLRRTPPLAPPEMRVEISTPATDTPQQFALSPDGPSRALRHPIIGSTGPLPVLRLLRRIRDDP